MSKLRNFSPERIDRRIVWWLILIVITAPLLVPLNIPVTVNPNTIKVYNYVQGLQPGSVALVSLGMSAGAWPELDPLARAFFWHLMQKNVKVVLVGFGIPDTGVLCETLIKEVESSGATVGKKYGVDYVNVGFIPGGEITLAALTSNFQAVVKADFRKTPANELPLLAGIRDYRDITFAVDFDGVGDYLQWVRQWVPVAKKPVICMPTAAASVEPQPFFSSGQLFSIVAGLHGGAEYERLINRPAFATRSMDMVSVAHFTFLGLVIVGNIFYFSGREKKK